jgi:beta-lactamase class A
MLVMMIGSCRSHTGVDAQAIPLATPAIAAGVSPTPAPPLATATVVATATVMNVDLSPFDNEVSTPIAIDPDVPSDSTPVVESADVETTVAIERFDPTDFQSRIGELIGEVGGDLEVVVALADGSLLFERDSTVLIESASLYKLAIMVELFRQRETQDLSLDEAIVMLPDYFFEDDEVYGWDWIGSTADLGSLLASMITLSSNVAAAALLSRLGNDAINQTMDDLGLHATRILWDPGIWISAGVNSVDATDRRPEPRRVLLEEEPLDHSRLDGALNVTTAADIAALFIMLLNGDVINPEASVEMLDLLARQQITDRLPRYLPDGTMVAHKTGNWDGLVHDAGVIWAPSGPIVVVVLSDISDEGRAVELIAGIALEAYLLER